MKTGLTGYTTTVPCRYCDARYIATKHSGAMPTADYAVERGLSIRPSLRPSNPNHNPNSGMLSRNNEHRNSDCPASKQQRCKYFRKGAKKGNQNDKCFFPNLSMKQD